jgi:hypothetical protein
MPYIGSSASPLPVNFSAVQSQSFSGTGSQVAFTLSRTVPSTAALEVLVNNVQQSPYDGSYSITGTTLTFDEAPAAGTNNVYVIYRDQALGSLVDQTAYRSSEVDTLLATKQAASNNLTAYADTGVGMRNRIINGDMRIDQRNAGASVTVSTNVFTVDRFLCDMGGLSNYTAQRSTVAPTGFTNSLLMTMGTGATIDATDYAFLRQAIEGFNTADLALGTANASPFTLSFWVRSSVTGTFGVSFRNSAANTTYCATYAINSANVWEYKTVVVPAITSGTWLTDNGAGMFVFWDLGVGSTFSGTANQLNTGSNFFGVTGTTKLAATTGATFYITGVQLEKGSVATEFERRPYGTELALCQRYLPAWSGSSGNQTICSAYTNTTTTTSYVLNHPVQTRVPPTGLVATGTFFLGASNNAFTVTSLTFALASTGASQLNGTISGGTANAGGSGFGQGSWNLYLTGCEL